MEVHDQSGETYNPNKQIKFKTAMLRSGLCDYSDAYIVVKGDITVLRGNNDAYDKKLAFRNNAPFISCILEINNTLIDNAEDLDIVMPMYNLLEYSKNYRKTTGSLWNYYRDEPNSGLGGDDNNINYSIKDSKSFNYKTSITGKLGDNNRTKENVEIVVPLKYLSNFWRTLDMVLINCEVSLILTWSKNCVLTSEAIRNAEPGVNAINYPAGAPFKIKDTKLYVPVVTLSAENDNKLLKQLKTGFKRTITWNKYRSAMSNQDRNKNLNFLIDPTFTNVNGLFVLSFENEEDRTSFEKYYERKIEIRDFNVLINQKPFFEIPVKNKEEAYEPIIEMSKKFITKFGNCCLICIKMETQKIVNLLHDSDNESSKFATRKRYIINDENIEQYGERNENDSTIKFEIKVIKPNHMFL